MIKHILSAATLGLLTAAIYLGIDGLYTMLEMRLENGLAAAPLTTARAPALSPRESPRAPRSRYAPIETRNLFKTETAASLAAAREEEKKPPPEKLRQTNLKLKLWGTVAGSESTRFAIIEDAVKRQQDLYRVGEQIQNATIQAILRERVVLRRNGKDEALDIEKKTLAAAGNAAVAPPSPVTPPLAENPPENLPPLPFGENENQVKIPREQVQDAVKNVNELMRQVRIRPHFTNGQPDGLALSAIKPNSLFQQIGLKNGDVIMGVDGAPIESVDDALRFYTRLKDATAVDLQIRRNGKDETIQYAVE